jgi:NAD(P)H-quinone oxidoreductase subunit 6
MDNYNVLSSWSTLNADALETFAFYILAAIAIPFAFGVIFDKAVIRSGFLLIGVFGTISGLFLLLQAQFIAMAQIMIYAVGITLVVVIALMLTNPRSEVESAANTSKGRLLGFCVAFTLFMTIHMAIRSEYWPVKNEVPSPNNVAIIGDALTGPYSIPFEFASVLLLAALMGAIMLAKNDPPGDDDLEYSELVSPRETTSETPEALTSSR